MVDTLQLASAINPNYFQGVVAEGKETKKGQQYFVVVPPPHNVSSPDTEYADDIIY